MFGLDCVVFEAIAQMLCSPMRAGDTQRMVLCDLEMKEKRSVLWGRNTCLWGPNEPLGWMYLMIILVAATNWKMKYRWKKFSIAKCLDGV